MKKAKWWVLLICLALFFSLACAAGELVSNVTNASQPTGTPAATGDVYSLDEGLPGLRSYRVQMIVKVTGQDSAGKAITSSSEILDENNQAQLSRHMLAKTESTGQAPGSIEVYQMGNDSYVVSTENTNQMACLKMTNAEYNTRSAQVLRPASIFQRIGRSQLVAGGEMVNGTATDHYKVSELKLGIGQASQVDGDLWILKDSGAVLRFTGSAEGQLSLTDTSGQARMEWDYYLLDINQAQVALPDDCKGIGLEDIPLTADATDVGQVGPTLNYNSPSTAGQVADYYRKTLLERGWTIDQDSGTGVLFSIVAVKGNSSLDILITSADKGCKVVVTKK